MTYNILVVKGFFKIAKRLILVSMYCEQQSPTFCHLSSQDPLGYTTGKM